MSGLRRAASTAPWRVADLAVRATRRRVDLGETLLVQGSPRSGTTWVMEMTAAALDRIPISEPFHRRKIPDLAGRLGLTSRPYRPAGTVDADLDTVLRRLLEGRLLRPGYIGGRSATPARVARYVGGHPVAIKTVRAAFLLPYLCERFPTLKTVLVVRDPYAVVSSQLRFPIPAQPPAVLEPILADWPQLRPNRWPTEPEEMLAVQWCIEHAFLEASRERLGSTLVLRYEDLVAEPERELRRLLGRLDQPWDPRFLELVDRPSRHTRAGSSFLIGDPLVGYRKHLTEDQIGRIAAVLDEYGHPFR